MKERAVEETPTAESLQASKLLTEARARTPARLLAGRAGTGYRTATQLSLRADHAAARDAVDAEVDPERDLVNASPDEPFLIVSSQAASKAEYLLRPDLGRELDESGRAKLRREGIREATLQIVIGDGLSSAAVVAQVPRLLPLLLAQARGKGFSLGKPIFVRHCRVGIMNNIGDLLNPKIVILLIGERPGLATAESLSAYMAYSPRQGDTDANRNLISNIHRRGVPVESAAPRILALAMQMLAAKQGGVAVKEQLPPTDRVELLEARE